MQRFQGIAATAAGVRSNGASIRVVLASDGVTLATLYSTNDLTNPTPLINPFLADTTGVYQFYARNGRYTVIPSVGTPVAVGTLSDVLLYDPLDELPGSLPGTVVDVRAYGVKADGVTDDTAALRAALAALSTTAGGVLLLPAASTILVSDFLGFSAANVEVRGGGPGTVIQQTVGNQDLFRTNGYLGITLRDFAITRSATDVSGSGVNASAGSHDLHIIRVESTGFGAFLNATSCDRIRVQTCTAVCDAGGRTGVLLTSCAKASLTDFLISGFAKSIEAVTTDQLTGERLFLVPDAGNTNDAITLTTTTKTVLRRVIGNGFNRALNAVGGSRVQLLDSVWDASSVSVPLYCSGVSQLRLQNISLPSVGAGVNAITLIDCTDAVVQGCVGNGALSFVNVTGGPRTAIRHNTWTGAATNVISVSGLSSYGVIRHNNFYVNFSGIVLNGSLAAGAPDTWTIENNIVQGGTGTFAVGVELLGVWFCTVADNFCVANNTGVHLENTGAGDPSPNRFSNFNRIEDNYCLDNTTDGIYTQNHAQNTFVGNKCIGNGRHGIVINSGTQIAVVGNTCNCNARLDVTGAGIAIATTNEGSVVGNTCARLTSAGHIIGSQKYGILIDATASNTLADGNYCHGNVTAQLQNNGAGTLLGTNWTT